MPAPELATLQEEGTTMRVRVELDDEGELLIHAIGCRTGDPEHVVPLVSTAVVRAIQKCRAGGPMPVAGPSPADQLRTRVAELEGQLEVIAGQRRTDDERLADLRRNLVAAERREGQLRVERDRHRDAAVVAGTRADGLRIDRDKIREQTRTLCGERDEAIARAERAEKALADAPGTEDFLSSQDVQRRVAVALLDEDRRVEQVAELVGASAGLVRRWEVAR